MATSLAAVLCWLLVGGLIYFFAPEGWVTFAVFFGLLFVASFLTAGIIWGQRRRALITAILVGAFFVMRYFGEGNLLNLILLGSFLITVEIYLTKYR